MVLPINKPSLAAARPVDPGLNGLRRRRANPVLAGAAHRAHALVAGPVLHLTASTLVESVDFTQ